MKNKNIVMFAILLICIWFFWTGYTAGNIWATSQCIAQYQNYNYNMSHNMYESLRKINISCPEPSCPQQICISPPCYQPNLIIEAQLAASAHDYDIKDYNCNDFADDLIRRLKNDGYHTSKCYGFYEGQYHAWVEIDDVWIEATKGNIIEIKDRSKYAVNYCN